MTHSQNVYLENSKATLRSGHDEYASTVCDRLRGK